ncbi:glycosyltransferase [Amylibacter sp.]|nr:glycosyltransferase [Amylibacter sp.]
MKISIIMGIYNGDKYLSDAIESILVQSMPDFEFIIVDDGSTDNTGKIIFNFAKKDSRIKSITLEENKGLANALNVGIRASSGEFIARMDCDDISLPERLEKQFCTLKKNDIDILGTQVININSSGNTIKTKKSPTSSNNIKYILPYENCINHPTVMMKKSSLENIGLYNVEYKTSQDYELWLRLLPKFKFANLEEPLVKYRKGRKILSDNYKHNQTLFSVYAALNYFLSKYHLKNISPNDQISSLVRCFKELCSLELTIRDQRCINRHMMRLSRRCKLDKNHKRTLNELIIRSATTKEKYKWLFYKLITANIFYKKPNSTEAYHKN